MPFSETVNPPAVTVNPPSSTVKALLKVEVALTVKVFIALVPKIIFPLVVKSPEAIRFVVSIPPEVIK
jgi:hypothetical protein